MKKHTRRPPSLHYRRVVYFITEGEKTERAYLEHVKKIFNLNQKYRFSYKHNQSDIASMLRLAKETENSDSFKKTKDKLWILLDRDSDNHTSKQLSILSQWLNSPNNYKYVAISTPCFEYWLLLHFEEKPSVKNCKSNSYMSSIIPNYKTLPISSPIFTQKTITTAIKRASKNPPSITNPDIIGSSMGILINSLISNS